jgi:hypothetical protein
MSSDQPKLKVHLEWGETKMDFEGSPEEVVQAFLNVICKVYPSYPVVKNLTLTVDLESLLKDLSGVIAFTVEGAVVLVPKERLGKLSVRELIAIHLTKVYIGKNLSMVEKNSLSIDELLTAIGGRIGALAGRLSEMVNEGFVERVGRGEYKITTYGIEQFQKAILPKVKQLL